MEVRCIDGKNTKLIEGQIYDALLIIGDIRKATSKYAQRQITLHNGDSYTDIHRFETLDNIPITEVYVDERVEHDLSKLSICRENISEEDILKTWIKYTGSNYSKYFVQGNYYKVSDVNPSSTYHNAYEFTVKIEGFKHWTTTHSFRLLKKEEIRNLKIDIIDGKEVVTTNFTRKFDAISDDRKFKVIMNSLLKAKDEFSRNNFKDLTIEEYIVGSDNKYGINLDDIEEFKQVKIPELFK